MSVARGPWVIIDVEEDDRYGSLVLPEKRGADPTIDGVGRVVSCGAGYYGHKNYWYGMPVRVGDRVAFRSFLKHAAILNYGDNTCAIHMRDVLAVLDEERVGLQLVSASSASI